MNLTTSNMFAVQERLARSAHFPAATDLRGCLSFYRDLFTRYDRAMMAGDSPAALAVKAECDLFLETLAEAAETHVACGGRRRWGNRIGTILARRTAAAPGAMPLWGQAGSFVAPFQGVPVRFEVDGLVDSLGMYGENLMPHFSIHIVEKTRLFPSETGYESFFCSVFQNDAGLDIGRVAARLVDLRMKSAKRKLVPYAPWSGLSGAWRRERMLREGVTPDAKCEDATGPAPEDDGGDGGALFCDGCSTSLEQLDDYTENECGLFCGDCLERHAETCDACEIELLEEHGGVDPRIPSGGELRAEERESGGDTLPGFADAVEAHIASASAVAGEALTAELLRPLGAVDRVTGALESHSPLFRGSAADPQLSLF